MNWIETTNHRVGNHIHIHKTIENYKIKNQNRTKGNASRKRKAKWDELRKGIPESKNPSNKELHI